MPRFSKKEKQIIRVQLLEEGRKLFAAQGIQKVTVDELCTSVGIAKGSFYSFFENKEDLFMAIIDDIHEQFDELMGQFLKERMHLPPETLLFSLFQFMFDQVDRFPIMRSFDSETIAYLYRKVPEERLTAHLNQDTDRVEQLKQIGIQFNYDDQTVAAVLQQVAVQILTLDGNDSKVKKEAQEIILRGVVAQIVRSS